MSRLDLCKYRFNLLVNKDLGKYSYVFPMFAIIKEMCKDSFDRNCVN